MLCFFSNFIKKEAEVEILIDTVLAKNEVFTFSKMCLKMLGFFGATAFKISKKC